MNFEMREPCKTCPYRTDVPAGTWHWSEFENLLQQDAYELGGSTFACHMHGKLPKDQRGFCIGWLLDQRQRNVPSIQLRLTLCVSTEAAQQLEEARSPVGVKMYGSIAAMCRANGVRAKR